MADIIRGTKRKRGSKNRKKGWRTTDIQDVEEFLEDTRLQERTGGIAAEKSNEQLFFVDKVTEDELPSDTPRKTRRQNKALRCHSNLLPDPNTKPLRLKTHVKTKTKKPPSVLKANLYKAAVASNQRLKAKEARKTQIKAEKDPRSFHFDLWDEEGKSESQNNVDGHYMAVTKKMTVRSRKTLHKKPSEIPAVEVAHPGASYNPAYDDHQELLMQAHNVELKKEKVANKLKRALDEKFPSKAPGEKEYLEEMSIGLTEDSSGDEGDESDEDLDKLSVNPPVRREDKKTITQRNKEREKRSKNLKVRQEKEDKLIKKEMFRIKQIKKEIQTTLTDREKNTKIRAAEKTELRKTRTKKLGSLKFDEPDLELKLSEELEGSLRRLKPEGHLLEDRFKSLQKRNIIEPRTRSKVVRKYKKKVFTKKSHRDDLA